MSRNICGCHNREGGCHWHLVNRGQDAAKLLQCTEQLPAAKNSPVQNVNGADIEKPFFIAVVYLFIILYTKLSVGLNCSCYMPRANLSPGKE